MRKGRRKASARREPAFDAASSSLDLRLWPQDRAGASAGNDPKPRPTRRGTSESDGGSRPRKSSGSTTRAGGKRGGGGRGRRSHLARFLYWSAVLGLWMVIAAIGGAVWIGAHLPPIQSLEIPKRPPSIQMAGLDRRVFANRGDMGGAAVSIKDLPPYLGKAFVAIEDRRFYSHHGVDPLGITRAFIANVLHRGLSQGGSTLTQQLAKNLFLTQERTVGRKIQELALAFWLERKFTKTEILELYLNRVYFGSGAYGVEGAAQRYFGKPARQVTLSEAAMLAGLVKSPSRLAPIRNPDGAERRAQTVLLAMADTKSITEEMAKVAIAHPAHAVPQAGTGSVNYVADWIMDVLDDLIGRVDQDIVIETSIDPVLQAAAEKALVDEIAQKGEKFGVSQGAVVAMTPDGTVRALVGGKNYAESQFNRAIAAKRQPGSAFKPFAYLTAIERGLTPETVREDRPLDVKGWRPENYSREYFGPVTLTKALALSLNTVAVRLTLEVGPAAVIKTAHRLGISSKLEPNASIALGTSEVSVIELVGAFATFANGGLASAPHVVERVHTADGTLLYTRTPESLGRIIDARSIGMMNQMMQETLLTGTARTAQLPGWPAAGKTGTSQDFRDAWFVGYTSHLVAGVWLGNDDGSPTHKTTGSGLPVEIWSRLMKTAHQGIPVAGLPGIGGGVPVAAAMPPANVPGRPQLAEASRPAPAANKGGLDDWLLGKLFGRR
ncbi:MAG: penicillin-binding protein [Alphaproteobacteria bacterium]|nr:penicillin-binding protein [Alphaproteobacteria bacterium]